MISSTSIPLLRVRKSKESLTERKQTRNKRLYGYSQRSGYPHLYPRTQQGSGASIATHSARYRWTRRSTVKQKPVSDIICTIVLLVLSEREPAESSLSLLISSSVSRALYAGAFELSTGLPARSPPAGIIHFAESSPKASRHPGREAKAKEKPGCALRQDLTKCHVQQLLWYIVIPWHRGGGCASRG